MWTTKIQVSILKSHPYMLYNNVCWKLYQSKYMYMYVYTCIAYIYIHIYIYMHTFCWFLLECGSPETSYYHHEQVDGLVQNCSISSALAIEIRQSCTEPSKCCSDYVKSAACTSSLCPRAKTKQASFDLHQANSSILHCNLWPTVHDKKTLLKNAVSIIKPSLI